MHECAGPSQVVTVGAVQQRPLCIHGRHRAGLWVDLLEDWAQSVRAPCASLMRTPVHLLLGEAAAGACSHGF